MSEQSYQVDTPDGIEIIEDVSRYYRGTAYKFKTDYPIAVYADKAYEDTVYTEYFIISATMLPMDHGCETMVFPGEEHGTAPIEWGEIAGSTENGYDIEGALDMFADRYL